MSQKAVPTNAPNDSSPAVDLLPALVAGRAGRKYRGSIWTVRGLEGHVAFGPYCHLPLGKSELIVEVELGSAHRASDDCSGLTVEAIYGDVVFGLATLPNSRSHSSCSLMLRTSQSWGRLMIEPRFEARISNHGDADGRITRAVLKRGGSEVGPHWDIPGNWISLLTVGPAGSRTMQGILGVAGEPGVVFYGPYRAFLPGRYKLSVDYYFHQKAVRKPEPIVLEIVQNAVSILAAEHIELRHGQHTFEMEFAIATTDLFPDAASAIEFRLSKNATVSLLIEAIRVRVQEAI